MKEDNNMKEIDKMFPLTLMTEGIKLAKSRMKNQMQFALLWADAIRQQIDGVELIKACFCEAGFTSRDARGTTSNASKFVAPAILFRNGDITEKNFFSIRTKEASDAFKLAGGMKNGGLEPQAWQAAYEDNEKKSSEVVNRTPDVKQNLTFFEILSAIIGLRKSELNKIEIETIISLLKA